MRKKILRSTLTQLIIGLLLLNFSLYAQTIALPNVKPVSPTSAAMFKVFEKPIGTSTGTVPITFDLFSVSDGNITLPIKLDYNSTGGIKVEEIASSVGLGFNLSAGGRITRIPNGLPDDHSSWGFLFNTLKPSMLSPSNMSHLELVHLNQFDKAPDVFMFNVNGHSGKFMFDENKNIVMMEKSDMTVRCRYYTNTNGIEGFDLYDSEGNVYIFNMAESTQQAYTYLSGSGGSAEEAYKSSWVLTSIRDQNNQNLINLEYESGWSNFSTLSGGFMKILVWNFMDCHNSSNNPDQVIAGTDVSELWLKRISGTFGRLEFQYTRDRLENTGGGKLRDITLYNSNSQQIKKIKFNYGYIGTGTSSRLKLINYSEFASNDTDSLTHRFEYEETTTLPPRGSNSVDLWGYYNGRSNSTVFPNISTKFYNASVVLDMLADREADGFYGQSNILKKITFPTGATRQFFYEGNTVLPMVNDHFLNSSISIPQSFAVDNFVPADFPVPNLRHTFNVNTSENYATLSLNLNSNYANAFRIEVYGGNYSGNYGEGSPMIAEYVQRSLSLQLPSGTYTVLVYIFGALVPYGNVLEGYWVDKQQLPQDQVTTPYGKFVARNQEVGGVRVKKISDYDPVTGQTLTTDYLYNMFSTNANLTSGLLSTPIRLLNEYNSPGCLHCQYLMLFANPTYPLAMNGSSYVVYPEVRTLQSGNGYTDQKFAYWQENVPDETQYPIVPIISKNDGYRGKLLNEQNFNQSGTLLSEKSYSYSQINTSKSIIAKVIRLKYSTGGACMEYSTGQLPNMLADEITYEYNDILLDLTNYQEKRYTSQGIISTNIDHTYSIMDGVVVKRESTSNSSNGNITKLQYKYPDDPLEDFNYALSSNEVAVKNILKSRLYKQPIEIVRKVVKGNNTITQEGEKYNFSSFGNNIYHLGNYRLYSASGDFEDTFFLGYNINGTLQEFKKSNNSNSVYVWGYGGQYPVLEIKNATYAEILTVLTQAAIDNLNSNQSETTMETLIKNAADKIRSNSGLAKAMVTSYTYKPLVGMTSKTDARGVKETYKYDGKQRLQAILDHLNQVTKSIDYHYRSN